MTAVWEKEKRRNGGVLVWSGVVGVRTRTRLLAVDTETGGVLVGREWSRRDDGCWGARFSAVAEAAVEVC